MLCNPVHGDRPIHNSHMTLAYPCHLWAYTMLTFAVGLPLACFCFPKTKVSVSGFINIYSLDFCLISSGVGALSFHSVYYVANIVLKSSLFTPSINFEAMLKFLLLVDSPDRFFSSSSQDHPEIDQLIRHLFVFLFQISSLPDDHSCLFQIDSTVLQMFYLRYHAPLLSWLPRTLVLCPLDCLKLLCRPVSHDIQVVLL